MTRSSHKTHAELRLSWLPKTRPPIVRLLPLNPLLLHEAPNSPLEVAQEDLRRSSKKNLGVLPSRASRSAQVFFEEEEDEVDKCVIYLDNVINVKLRPCGHSATCRNCTEELRGRNEPCPLCRKKIVGMDIGRWQSSIGEYGLWPTLLKNLTQLASEEDFNEYFRNMFDGNEEPYLRWKEVFDVLEIGNASNVGFDLPLEQQVLRITKSEDLVKLRALAKLCSREFFEDPSLSVAVWRRIFEVLVLAMPTVVDEKKARGNKKQKKKKNDPRKLEIFDACLELGKACNWVGDFDDCRRYYKRAKEGCEEQLGRDSEKALDVTGCMTMVTGTKSEKTKKYRDLLKRCERVLGEENVVTLETLNTLACKLGDHGEYEEAIKVYERCSAERMKALGEDHQKTLGTLNNLGVAYDNLKNYEKALEYYERALKGYEKTLVHSPP